MSSDSKRASERVIPMVSDEEMVVIDSGSRRFLSKMMDLSDGGSLVYLLTEDEAGPAADLPCELSLYHRGDVFSVTARIVRANGRLLAFQFTDVPDATKPQLQAKLIRMEVEWNRLQQLA
jgi:hypothetical protein